MADNLSQSIDDLEIVVKEKLVEFIRIKKELQDLRKMMEGYRAGWEAQRLEIEKLKEEIKEWEKSALWLRESKERLFKFVKDFWETDDWDEPNDEGQTSMYHFQKRARELLKDAN